MEDFLKQNIKKAENMDKYIKITGVFLYNRMLRTKLKELH